MIITQKISFEEWGVGIDNKRKGTK